MGVPECRARPEIATTCELGISVLIIKFVLQV